MKLKINNVTLEDIDSRTANDILNDINKATGGNLFLTSDYPALKLLYQLLEGSFRTSTNGIHFIDKRSND